MTFLSRFATMLAMEDIILPQGFHWAQERYNLKNDQGLDFVANIFSPKGNVISLFKAQQFVGFTAIDLMIKDYQKETNNLKLKKKFNIKIGEISYPIYIIEGDEGILIAQAVIAKGEQTMALITFLQQKGENFKDYAQKNPVLDEMVAIMRKNK